MAAGVAALLDWRSILIVALTVTVWLHYIRKKKTAALPPGPRGLPFVGNILDLPPSHHWLKFAELGDIWGMLQNLLDTMPKLSKYYVTRRHFFAYCLWADHGRRQLCESSGGLA